MAAEARPRPVIDRGRHGLALDETSVHGKCLAHGAGARACPHMCALTRARAHAYERLDRKLRFMALDGLERRFVPIGCCRLPDGCPTAQEPLLTYLLISD